MVKTMELVDKKVSMQTRSWVNRLERKHPTEVDYYSEMRSWLQHALLEAENDKGCKRKDLLLSLLRDL